MLLASQAKDPGQESSYRFCMAALGGVSGDLLCSRLGGIGNTVPSSSDVIPMGSKRFALQGIEYAFL